MGMKVLSTRGSSSRADLEALLRGSDVVSVHCPLTDRTRGLIGRDELALMRPGAILVNYSRGEVLQEEASTPFPDDYCHCFQVVAIANEPSLIIVTPSCGFCPDLSGAWH